MTSLALVNEMAAHLLKEAVCIDEDRAGIRVDVKGVSEVRHHELEDRVQRRNIAHCGQNERLLARVRSQVVAHNLMKRCRQHRSMYLSCIAINDASSHMVSAARQQTAAGNRCMSACCRKPVL